MKLLVTVIPTLLATCTFGQNQNNIWYFGNEAGLDFNSSPPTAIQGNLTTLEGTASVCDPAGNLLFYTNGETVWDRNHNVMPNGNGLLGGESSAQAALIVPLPNSCNQYYLFTTEDHYTNGGMHYSIVDICLNNGFGDIVSSSKNTLVVDRTAEKITAVLHSNGIDIWIITHRLNSSEFLAYLLSSSGLNATPVISAIGSFYPSNAHIGPARASHDGKKIVSSATFHDICDMFDFNATTGRLSNYYDINQLFSGQRWMYGIEFSPNDSLLYLSTTYVTNYLYQVDLKTKQLRTLNSMGGNYHYGALLLGPDKKIYMARNNSDFLDIIHRPDTEGNGCQYEEGGIQLVPGTFSLLGLPNFTPYSFLIDTNSIQGLGKDTLICMGNTLELLFSLPGNCATSYQWNDGTSGSYKVITQSGVYWVEAQNSCIIYRDTIQVEFAPLLNSLINAEICFGESYDNYSKPGVYVDTFSIPSGCDSVRTLILAVNTPEKYLNITLCEGDEFEQYTYSGVYVDTLEGITGECDTVRHLELTFLYPLETYINHSICDGQIFLGYSDTGVYMDTLEAVNGCDSIRILNLVVSNEIYTDEFIQICLGDSYLGHSSPGMYIDTFQSLFGCDSIHRITLEVIPIEKILDVEICHDNKFENYSLQGTYIDTIQGTSGPCDTIRLLHLTVLPIIESTLVSSICSGENYDGYTITGIYLDTLISSKGCDSIRILDLTSLDQLSSYINASVCDGSLLGHSKPGIYVDTLVSSQGCDSIRTLVLEGGSKYIPNVFSPNGDGINDVFSVFQFPEQTLEIQYFGLFDRFGDMVYETDSWPVEWNGTSLHGIPYPSGVFAYIIIYDCGVTSVVEHGNVTIIR